MPLEFKRMEEFVHALEPLALAYERFVTNYNMEPREVYLRLTCECDGKPEIHIPGESLAAAANCWRELNDKLKSQKMEKNQTPVRPKSARAPDDRILERSFTGTFRGRLRGLKKLRTKYRD